MSKMTEYQKEYLRMAAFLHMMGFQQSKNDLTEFWKPFSLDVKAQVVDQDKDETFHLDGTINIHLYGEYIRYSYQYFAAVETGRLLQTSSDFKSDFTFDTLLKSLSDIFDRIYGSPEYEFYNAPYYDPSTIMHVTAFKLFGDKVIEERKIDPDISAKFV